METLLSENHTNDVAGEFPIWKSRVAVLKYKDVLVTF
jgi:hypothetical protein